MSNKVYPNIDSEKAAKDGVCMKCKQNLSSTNLGTTFCIEVSYMNGDDEFETYCRTHAHERRMEIRKIHEDHAKRKLHYEQKHEDLKASLLDRLKAKFEVRELTPYQWRINECLDVFPKNRLYHDIKQNKRGGYRDVLSFVEGFFRVPINPYES